VPSRIVTGALEAEDEAALPPEGVKGSGGSVGESKDRGKALTAGSE
jgi:hypothetical protein